MAQELREGDGKAGIVHAGKRKWGYDPAQVDAFLERAHALYDSEGVTLTQRDIQDVSFDLAKNGYVISQVDAALGRLERAVVDKRTTWEITHQGRVAWKAQTEKLYHEILNHVERSERQRFKPGEPKRPSYDKKQVDRLADQIIDKAAAALGVDGVSEKDVRNLAGLNTNTVNNAIFTQRKGKKGYDERQVDYFLSVCVQLLGRIESYARVADFVSGEPSSQVPMPSAEPAKVEGISPLFTADAQRPTAEGRFGSAAPVTSGESFDALHQAEQNLFTPPAASEPNNTSASYAATAAFDPIASPAAPPVPAADVPSFAPAPVPTTPMANATPPVSGTPSYAPLHSPVAETSAIPAGASPSFDTSQTDSSLAALAHMAEISQDMPAIDTPSFTPKMPSLDTPSALNLNDMPAPVAPVTAFTPAPGAAPMSAATPLAAPLATPVSEPAPPQTPAVHQPAPETMPVSFAPTTKPARTTGSVPRHTTVDKTSHAQPVQHAQPASAQPVQPVQPAAQPQPTAATPHFEPLPAAKQYDTISFATQPEQGQKPEPKQEENQETKPKQENLFPSFFPIESDFDTDIPDLSFPTLTDDDTDYTKKEQ
jgi:DivIVA domain-containing protein